MKTALYHLIPVAKPVISSYICRRWQIFDDSLVQSVAERGTEVMQCATMLFLGMVDDATTFAETHGGGGGGSDLKWGRDEDEDNRAWARRCMRMASRMMRPASGKKPKR